MQGEHEIEGTIETPADAMALVNQITDLVMKAETCPYPGDHRFNVQVTITEE